MRGHTRSLSFLRSSRSYGTGVGHLGRQCGATWVCASTVGSSTTETCLEVERIADCLHFCTTHLKETVLAIKKRNTVELCRLLCAQSYVGTVTRVMAEGMKTKTCAAV
ncbi:hypothetical protein AAFF_G00352920 [Aldrovandia affinis]|uniref:Uncharacterized protein n=1 Tax=Aldrovandia affinis TaxID=143900 RepID=A0AAD7SIZ8_9TELE|nr:hypothetical protein AAFF_G00352920 [Aldrovandia affinis]